MAKSSEEARRKKNSGIKAEELFKNVVVGKICSLNLNVSLQPNYQIGYSGMEQKQFKADFALTFHDFHEKWLISSTSSPRSDRFLGDEFKAMHIRKLDNSVTRYYVVVPSSISDDNLRQLASYSRKITESRIMTFITDAITIDEFVKLFIDFALSNLSQGILSNILGKHAEVSIIETLNNPNNVILWNNPSQEFSVKSDSFRIFKTMLMKLGFEPNSDVIRQVIASNDIDRLSNGGSPKTDVKFRVDTDIFSKEHTITIKNTKEKVVSVHEGSVLDIIEALKIDRTTDLADALMAFEKAGSEKGLENQPKGNHYKNILDTKLPKYSKELVEFALFGVNSPLITSADQMADCILFTRKYKFMSREAYVAEYLRLYRNRGTFSTPLRWTRPSKKRGKIQLKGFTNN